MIVAVEVLKLSAMRIAKPVRGGGALGARMNLFDRFARVVKVRKAPKRQSFTFSWFSFNILIVVVVMVRFCHLSNAVIRKRCHKFV